MTVIRSAHMDDQKLVRILSIGRDQQLSAGFEPRSVTAFS
jgi:hypothetical protein